MPGSLEIVITTDDIAYLVSVLRGEIDADDIDLTDVNGIEIGLQPSLFDTDDGEVLIEARTSHRHLMGGCDGKLARQIADSLDGTSGVQVPVMLSYCTSGAPGSEQIEVAAFFVADRVS